MKPNEPKMAPFQSCNGAYGLYCELAQILASISFNGRQSLSINQNQCSRFRLSLC